MTFNRDVLSVALQPSLHGSPLISADAKDRAKFLESEMSTPLGAYSHSNGDAVIQKSIAKFIEERDGPMVHADPAKIYLTNGASEGVRHAFKLILRDSNDGVMVPIPQYPCYSALLTLEGAKMVDYYLDEDSNWGLDVADMEMRIKEAKDKGVNIRAMTVINPGNPTG